MRIIMTAAVLATAIASQGCGTVRATLDAYRSVTNAAVDDLLAAVDGVADREDDDAR
tara:strand:+ start:1453 stop:1623 length:171 start_codon:yes stop_codon:yes gene_type:complete